MTDCEVKYDAIFSIYSMLLQENWLSESEIPPSTPFSNFHQQKTCYTYGIVVTHGDFDCHWCEAGRSWASQSVEQRFSEQKDWLKTTQYNIAISDFPYNMQ